LSMCFCSCFNCTCELNYLWYHLDSKLIIKALYYICLNLRCCWCGSWWKAYLYTWHEIVYKSVLVIHLRKCVIQIRAALNGVWAVQLQRWLEWSSFVVSNIMEVTEIQKFNNIKQCLIIYYLLLLFLYLYQ